MKRKYLAMAFFVAAVPFASAQTQSEHETPLCEAARTNLVVELVYDADASKGCLPRVVDVHQVAIGNNGQLYLHGWQTRGCTKGRDYASERIFRFDKIKSVGLIEGEFDEKSLAIKAEGWDGCIGTNCFIPRLLQNPKIFVGYDAEVV